jgi:hypothetical protein
MEHANERSRQDVGRDALRPQPGPVPTQGCHAEGPELQAGSLANRVDGASAAVVLFVQI